MPIAACGVPHSSRARFSETITTVGGRRSRSMRSRAPTINRVPVVRRSPGDTPLNSAQRRYPGRRASARPRRGWRPRTARGPPCGIDVGEADGRHARESPPACRRCRAACARRVRVPATSAPEWRSAPSGLLRLGESGLDGAQALATSGSSAPSSPAAPVPAPPASPPARCGPMPLPAAGSPCVRRRGDRRPDPRAGVPERREQPEQQPESNETTSVKARLARRGRFRSGAADSPGPSPPGRADRRRRAPSRARRRSRPSSRLSSSSAADDSARSRAERRAHRQLLLPPLRPHQQQIRHVGAGDQQHDADGRPSPSRGRCPRCRRPRACRDEEPARSASFVDARVDARGGRPGVHPDRHHPRDVGVRLGERHARLQARDPLKAEAWQDQPAAIESRTARSVGVRIEHTEALGHHAHDFPRARLRR